MEPDSRPIVFVACRRNAVVVNGAISGQSSSDLPINGASAFGQQCPSRRAYITRNTPSVLSYQCVECGHSWTMPVGGHSSS